MSMPAFDVIPMTEELCETVFSIAKQCLPEYWSLKNIQDILKYDNNHFYVVQDKLTKQAVGFAGIMIIVDEAELLDIAILPEYRKQHLASELLEFVENVAKEAGAFRMLLEVRESNIPAKKLYSKFDYKMISTRKNYYSDPVEDAEIMEHCFNQ